MNLRLRGMPPAAGILDVNRKKSEIFRRSQITILILIVETCLYCRNERSPNKGIDTSIV